MCQLPHEELQSCYILEFSHPLLGVYYLHFTGEKIESKLLLRTKLKCPLLKDCALWLAWADMEGGQKVTVFSFR